MGYDKRNHDVDKVELAWHFAHQKEVRKAAIDEIVDMLDDTEPAEGK